MGGINFLELFISSGLIGGILYGILYFSGWTYRYVYFRFFQIDISSLDLPTEFFLVNALQMLFSESSFLRTLILILFLFILLNFITRLIKLLMHSSSKLRTRLSIKKKKAFNRVWIIQPPDKSNHVKQIRLNYLQILLLLLSIFYACFWLARYEGQMRSKLDAFNSTSSLPVITFVTQKDRLPLGRNLNNLFLDPSLKNYSIIGDIGLFEALRGQENNDTTNSQLPRVWRLLLRRNGWIYVFPALPQDPSPDLRPPVLMIRESEGGDQLLILSPVPSNPRLKSHR